MGVDVVKNGSTKDLENFDADLTECDKGPRFGVRHLQVFMLFLVVAIGYCMRVTLSVGIVAMTDNTTSSNPDIKTYHWDDKNVILSSFFWGYVLPQIGAGQLAKNYGPKWLLVIAMLVNAVFAFLIPTMADWGSYGVMIARALQGFAQGFFYPCCHNLLSKWVPLSERTRMGTIVYAGGPFGTVITMPITGWIAASDAGWPTAFYVFGAAGALWTVAYIFIGSNSPMDAKHISAEELRYIKKETGSDDAAQREAKTPWKEISMSLPVWAILVAHSGQNWGFWTLLTEIPLFMDKILKFNIKDNSMLSALPYFTLWILSFIFGALSDFCINKKYVTIGRARKITTTIGFVGPAIALVGLALVDSDDKVLAVTLLVLAVGINSSTYCGYQVNHIDLSPTHAGTLMGITNGIANIFSIVAPLAVEVIVTDEEDASLWAIVFYLAAGIYVAVNGFYLVFGQGTVQPWDMIKDDTELKDKPNDSNGEVIESKHKQQY